MICRWYKKELKDVTENEQEKCYEQAGRTCLDCGELVSSSEREDERTIIE
jgi:hypothetical protein